MGVLLALARGEIGVFSSVRVWLRSWAAGLKGGKLGCCWSWAFQVGLGVQIAGSMSGTGFQGGVASTACHDWIMGQWGEGRQAMWPADPELKQETKIVPFFQLFPSPRNPSKILSILISLSSTLT